jgi:hypothetical protein
LRSDQEPEDHEAGGDDQRGEDGRRRSGCALDGPPDGRAAGLDRRGIGADRQGGGGSDGRVGGGCRTIDGLGGSATSAVPQRGQKRRRSSFIGPW